MLNEDDHGDQDVQVLDVPENPDALQVDQNREESD